jgi:CDP-diacylglycerol---glycerol-3-phosphate 3-phosphatidyltransferase
LSGERLVNLPIALTLFRIVLVPLIMVFLISSSRVSVLIAAVIFVAASLTDWLDGRMARRWNQVTRLGTLLDPVADKLLVAAALVSLVHVEMLAAWTAVVIIGRELAVTGLRGVALSMGTVVPASSLGKAKTVSQYVAITVLILEKGVSPELEIFHLISRGVLWIALALTVVSGVDYFYRFFLHTNPKDLIKDRERWP